MRTEPQGGLRRVKGELRQRLGGGLQSATVAWCGLSNSAKQRKRLVPGDLDDSMARMRTDWKP